MIIQKHADKLSKNTSYNRKSRKDQKIETPIL